MTDHETRFGALWTNEYTPYARMKRLLSQIFYMPEEEFSSRKEHLSAQIQELKAHLTEEQYFELLSTLGD